MNEIPRVKIQLFEGERFHSNIARQRDQICHYSFIELGIERS